MSLDDANEEMQGLDPETISWSRDDYSGNTRHNTGTSAGNHCFQFNTSPKPVERHKLDRNVAKQKCV